MGLKSSRIEVRIGGVDLAAMPPGGERRLREAVAAELAALSAGAPTARRPHDPPDAGGRIETQIARRVHAEVSRKVKP